MRVAMGAAALVAAGLIIWFSIARSAAPRTDMAGVPGWDSVTWTSPTDFLLTSAEQAMFDPVPMLRDSIVNRLLGE